MIREAKISDSNIIADIIIESWRSSFAGIVDDSYIKNMEREKYAGIFKNRISEQKEIILVHENNGSITGFASGSMDIKIITLSWMVYIFFPNTKTKV